MKNLNAVMTKNRCISAYHEQTGEAFGEETQSTFWMFRNKDGKRIRKFYHIDYCYIPNDLDCELKILDKVTDRAIEKKEIRTGHYRIVANIKD